MRRSWDRTRCPNASRLRPVNCGCFTYLDGSTARRRVRGFAMPVLGERAVVLGASMGGLLAARLLADFFENVTVDEPDVLSDDPANRRGVPPGRHVHALLPGGAQILDELFPG